MFKFSDTLDIVEEPKMRDRIVIGAIAFSQLLFSLWSLGVGMTYLGGPLFLLYGIWGLITAVALVPSSIRARKSAIAWHVIFVALIAYGFAVSNSSHYSSKDWFFLLWAAAGLAAIFYLASGLDHVETKNE